MKPLMFVYDSMVELEIGLIAMLINDCYGLATVGIEKKMATSWGGLSIMPQYSIDEIDVSNHSALIIPGGKPEKYQDARNFFDLIKRFDEQDKIIAAICGGPAALAYAGVLKDKKYTTSLNINEYPCFSPQNFIDEKVVVDKNIITAQGNGFIEFAHVIGKKLGIFKNEEDEQGTINYWLGKL